MHHAREPDGCRHGPGARDRVEEPHRHHAKGKKFHVRINLHVPGKELVISKNPEDAKEDLHVAIDDAFTAAERVLEDHAKKSRGHQHRN